MRKKKSNTTQKKVQQPVKKPTKDALGKLKLQKELKIEKALEKVRVQALAMRKPADLLNLCKVLFQVLHQLGFDQLRNAQIHTFHDEKEELIDHEYSDLTGGAITIIHYGDQPLIKRYLKQIRRTKKAVSNITISGKQLEEWNQFRKKTGMKNVPVFLKAKAIHFYLYSAGNASIGISTFEAIDEAKQEILTRFRNVFDLAYRIFTDISIAEAQTREAEIQLSLERVRVRMMAMYKSDELKEVVKTLYEELGSFGFSQFATTIHFMDVENQKIEVWIADVTKKDHVESYYWQGRDNPKINILWKDWEEKKPYNLFHLVDDEKKAFDEYLFKQTDYKKFPDKLKKEIRSFDEVFFLVVNFKFGFISSSHLSPFTLENIELLQRFTRVFEQTYTRFLDLQKAEAQAREAEVELALERIRARTMAIQKSSELSEVIAVVFEQLTALGFTPEGCDIIIYDKEKSDAHYWFAGFEKGSDPKTYLVPYHEHPYYQEQINGWKNGEKYKAIVFEGVLKKKFDDHVFTKTGFKNFPESRKKRLRSLKYVVVHDAFMSHGIVETIDLEQIPDEKADVLQRIAKVFEQTYTRFLDIQKAEAQAREAQIEAALERVRATAIGMQHSEDIKLVLGKVFEELKALDVNLQRILIWIFDKEEKTVTWWSANRETNEGVTAYTIPYTLHPVGRKYFKAWKQQIPVFTYVLEGKEKGSWDEFLFTQTEMSQMPKKVQEGMRVEGKIYTHSAINEYGLMMAGSKAPLTENNTDIIRRFGNVFQQSYSRFRDLQKAEAQTREAQIEAALERVRTRTMALQNSDELLNAAMLMFQQLKQLGGNLFACGFALVDRHKPDSELWMSAEGEFQPPIVIPNDKEPVTKRMFEAWQKGVEIYIEEAGGDELKAHYEILRTLPVSGKVFQDMLDAGIKFPTWQRWHAAYFTYGYLLIITTEPYTDVNLFVRFAKVFDQTYTRFLDLKKAEAQAREAQIEAALERVRSRSMAMHKAEELAEVSAVLYGELKKLGITEMQSCGFEIIEEDKGVLQVWNFDNDVKQLTRFQMPLVADEILKERHQVWKSGQKISHQAISGQKLNEHLAIGAREAFSKTKDYITAYGFPDPAHFHFGNFSQGYLHVISATPLATEYQVILSRFAKVFEQVYTRFLDLQKAEAQAREAQIEAALERIRASALAMHVSEDLVKVAAVLREQMGLLGQSQLEGAVIELYDLHKDYIESWHTFVPAAKKGEPKVSGKELFRKDACALLEDLIRMYESPEKEYTIVSKGKKQKDFIKILSAQVPEVAKVRMPDLMYYSCADFTGGTLLIATLEEPSKETKKLLSRSSRVFDLAYKRFLDLKKAEEQAREAQIEVSLERVRARAMAMHQSEELAEAATVLFHELKKLGIGSERSGIGIIDYDNDSAELWLVTETEGKAERKILGYVKGNMHPLYRNWFETGRQGNPYFIQALEGSELKNYYEVASSYWQLPVPTEFNHKEVYHGFFFPEGTLNVISLERLTEEQCSIALRFAKVFGLTYKRFLDLQNAEAQAREAQIQLAMERVRARTMAMQKSEELPETSLLLFQQMKELGETAVQNSIGIIKEDEGLVELSTTVQGHLEPKTLHVPIDDPHVMAKAVAAWKAKRKSLTVEISGQELIKYNELRNSFLESKVNFPEDKWIVNLVFFSRGWLSFSSNKSMPDETIDQLKRFAAVFEQTYTRFLDLKKAEEQARDAQIEVALERVRAKAMAMHSSAELKEVALELRRQMGSLGLKELETCAIHLYEGSPDYFTTWAASQSPDSDEEIVLVETRFPKKGVPNLEEIIENYEHKKQDYVVFNSPEKFNEFINALKVHAPEVYKVVENTRRHKKEDEIQSYWSVSDFKGGSLLMATVTMPDENSRALLRRFANVFDLAYRRFTDLKQAEAQAREAQIEAALERVRSRTMGMRTSQEMLEVGELLYQELSKLGIRSRTSCGIGLIGKDDEKYDWNYMVSPNDHSLMKDPMGIPRNETKVMRSLNESWEKQEPYHLVALNEEETILHQTYIAQNSTNFPFSPQELIDHTPARLNLQTFNFKFGYLLLVGAEKLSADEIDITIRFAKVFEQTYTRFLDLQNAEAQAREAQVQLALERVRARTMAMHKSEELSETAQILFEQMSELGKTPSRIAIGIPDDKERVIKFWTTDQAGMRIDVSYKMSYDEPTSISKMIAAWKANKKSAVIDLSGPELKDWLHYVQDGVGIEIKQELIKDHRIHNVGFFSEGLLLFTTNEPLPAESIEILERFASVFNLTYRRFLDLQKAEAQVREAQIEAALERVRSRSIAMHKSGELADIAAKIFSELSQLDLALNRVLIWTFNDNEKYTTWWSSNPEVESTVDSYRIDYNDNPVFLNYLRAWQQRIPIHLYTLAGDTRKAWEDHLFEHTEMRRLPTAVKKGIREEGTIHTVSVVGDYGLMLSGSKDPWSLANIDIIQRFGRVFQQSYTRYLDVQKAEAQSREAEIQLALERVRARTMAMHKSEELAEVAAVLFQQLNVLGNSPERINIGIVKEEKGIIEYWATEQDGHQINHSFIATIEEPTTIKKVYDGWKEKKKSMVVDLTGEELKTWMHYLLKELNMPFKEELLHNRRVHTVAFFSQGMLLISTPEPVSQETINLLERFAEVFNLTYRRFLDLQKAEAQAREAQIEAALERVRSRSIAMHKSGELADIAAKIFSELRQLDLALNRVLIWTFNDIEKYVTWWSSNPEVETTADSYRIDYFDNPVFLNYLHAWQQRIPIHLFTLSGDNKKTWEDHLFEHTEMCRLPLAVRKGMREEGTLYTVSVIGDYGLMMSGSFEPLSQANIDIIQRFGRVFQQSYTRYLDVQKAEAQAWEGQIQLALERIRARSMAMQTSEELREVVQVMYDQVAKLQISKWGCFLMIFDKTKKNIQGWYSDIVSGAYPRPFDFDNQDHEVVQKWWQFWESDEEILSIHLKDEEKHDFLRYLFTKTEFKNIPEEVKTAMINEPEVYLEYTNMESGIIEFIDLEPFPEESITVLKRITSAFEQSYTRFLDLQKAEAQARESQIEASLERVRSRTMAMHTSDEFREVVGVVFKELHLSMDSEICILLIFNSERSEMEWWSTGMSTETSPDSFKILPESYNIPLSDEIKNNALVKRYCEALDKHVPYDVFELSYETKRVWDKYIFEKTELKRMPLETQQAMRSFEKVFLCDALINNGTLEVAGPAPLPEDKASILLRFAKVINQTYTRFLDLKNAEAQAREVEIQLALERVRAKTMAMQNSSELADASILMANQVRELGIKAWGCAFHIYADNEDGDYEWFTSEQGYLPFYKTPREKVFKRYYENRQKGETLYIEEFKGETCTAHYEYLMTLPVVGDALKGLKDSGIPLPSFQIDHVAYFTYGYLLFITYEPVPEAHPIFLRFAKEFEQTYTRFLDLQKAEIQAREAQIEASLERVRSKAMAMHNSADLSSAASTVFSELKRLGIHTLRSGVGLLTRESRKTTLYSATSSEQGDNLPLVGWAMLEDHPVLSEMYDKWLINEDYFPVLKGDSLKSYYEQIRSNFVVPSEQEEDYEQHGYFISFSHGLFYGWAEKPFTEIEKNTLKRFASVVDLTFKRFFDLQKAEAQAREAQIEASLERVRGKAMAMHDSDDMVATASMVFTELRKLGINPIRSGVVLLSKESRRGQLYSAAPSESGDSLSVLGWVQLDKHPALEKTYEAWIHQEDYFPELEGEQLKIYYQILLTGLSTPIPDFSMDQKQFGHFIPFSVGGLYAWSDEPFGEGQLNIFKRFSSIIDLTFRRYIELQNAEANAKEAVKQAALDRIRADIASMRTVNDLDRITPLIWNELNILGIPFIRCGVFIMDESQKLIHTFLSTPDGKAIAAFHLPFDLPGKTRLILENWQRRSPYFDRWDDSDFDEFAQTLAEQKIIQSKEQYLDTLPKGGIYLHFFPFLQGMFYVGNTNLMEEEATHLIQSVADAFSTAYARYEDFNRLEAAKQQVDRTLTDLRQTQQQLVQSEKMASLGELTAGIAHEIQNPLNFVNNFSDVNTELLEELKNEAEKGNLNDVIAITRDILNNEQKIKMHGERADAIVKSMLQHSRVSTGQKEPTDINSLCDEYLRLAYHGLRAKDKSFNTEFHTHFEPHLKKVNIVAQDIGRVMLNLYNNAFHAVKEKNLLNSPDYKPQVLVSTRQNNGKIEISIKDNGTGIPDTIKEKIFQPFFTTKPTGQGTGLGLSLSYDIVAAHGGEIKVESKQGDGTEFIIELPT